MKQLRMKEVVADMILLKVMCTQELNESDRERSLVSVIHTISIEKEEEE